MSETASGLLRVVILGLATSMFVLVWRGDRQTQQSFTIARKQAAERTRQRLMAEHHQPQSVALIHSSQVDFPTEIEPEGIDGPLATSPNSYVARVEVEMELPAEIAAGRYRVVDETGIIQTIHVLSGSRNAKGRDLYILDQADGSRRVFIRMSQVDDPVSAEAASAWRR